MVVKITSGSSIQGLVSYHETKVSEGEAKVISANNILGNFDNNFASISMEDKIDSFKQYLNANNRTENYTFHVSLNPDPDDDVTVDNYQEIAAQYMQAMGYGSQPYLVYLHTDIDRVHIHIISVRVDATGKKINSNWEFVRSDKIRKEIEKQYGLTPAEVQRLNEQQRKKREQRNAKISNYQVSFSQNPNRSNDLKGVFIHTLSYAKTYNLTSFNQYKALLKQMNVGFEIVKNKAGKDCGIVYFALNEKGERTTNSIKSSVLGKAYGLTELTAQFDKLSLQLKDKGSKQAGYNTYALDSLKKRIDINLFAKYEHMSLADFKKICADNRIELSLNINDSGRITGVTYIDQLSKKVFKGSDLGKKYSANAINDYVSVHIAKSIERKDQKELLSQVATLYYQFRKANTQNYFYESSFLKNYGVFVYAMGEELKIKNPEVSSEVISYSINKYFNYKLSNIDVIVEKENNRFRDNAEAIYAYSWSLPLDKRSAFLIKNGIKTEKDLSGKLRLVSCKDSSIGYLTEEVYSSTIWVKEENMRTRMFSRNVKELISAIQKGEGESYINSLVFDKYIPKMEVLEYLNDSFRNMFMERMHKCVLDSFLKSTIGMDNGEFIQAALKHGFIVYRENNVFKLKHYQHDTVLTDFVLDRDLSAFVGDVDKMVYDAKQDVSVKYKLFVQLNKVKTMEDAQKAIRFLQSRNKILYLQLKSAASVDGMIEILRESNPYLTEKSKLSKEDWKEINRAVFSYYMEEKKASGIYWETDFINAGLDKVSVNMKMKMATEYPYLTKEDIDRFVDKFIESKEQKLPEYAIGNKRKFMEKNKAIALYALKLPKEQRGEFLQKCGLVISKDTNGNVRLMSDCGSHVYLDMAITLKDMIGTIPEEKVNKFSYQNIGLFAAIEEKDIGYIEKMKYSAYNPNADIFKYITDEAFKEKVKDQMHFAALKGFLEINKKLSGEEFITEALKAGYIVSYDRDTKGFYIKDFAYDGSKRLKLGEIFTKSLSDMRYWNSYKDVHDFVYDDKKEVSRQYKLFVQLNKALLRGDLEMAQKSIAFIEKVNTDLYTKLNKVTGDDKERIEKMIRIISDYQNSNLRPDKEKHSRKFNSSRTTFLGFTISKGRKEKDKIKKTKFRL
ncbi:MAG: relaxase/mobilization nuclease domain-containing protein [Bacteroidales bacterium]